MAAKQSNKNSKVAMAKMTPVKEIVIKEERKKASLAAQAYAAYLVCPYDSDDIVEAPSPVPARETCVRHNLVVDLAGYNNTGEFSLEVRPHLSDTLSVTSKVADTQDQGTLSFEGESDSTQFSDVYMSGELSHLTTGFQQGAITLSDAAGLDRLGYPMNNSANPVVYSVNIQVRSMTRAAFTVRVVAFATGGNWTTLATVVIPVAGSGTGTASVTLPANCLGLAFTVFQNTFSYPLSCSVGITMTYSSGTGLVAFGKETCTQKTFGLPVLSSIKDIQHWRVTAQDVLITYAGDTLNDGGSIAAARVPREWRAGASSSSGNPYADILALPYDRYDGPLKEGAHVHWIPGEVDDLSPINSIADESQFGYFKMVAAGTMTHPEASIRVRICTTIAYYSTNPDYGQMNWAPPPTDLGLMLQYVARVVPAATANHKHIKKLAAFAKNNLSSGLKYLIENPEKLAALAKMAAALMA